MILTSIVCNDQGCSAQICSGGALIKEYIMQKLVKQIRLIGWKWPGADVTPLSGVD